VTWAKEWFTQLETVHRIVDENRKDNHRAVRVGILDTGIDSTHSEISQATMIKECKGFPDSLDPCKDKIGHGTHGASVFLKTAPQASLYIARVVDDQKRIAPDNDYQAVVDVNPLHIYSE
jgi:hypothetical protein